ncbi:MAG: radical SAM protein [Chitinivibrionales bacterium]|nr:radical SAM protein [Chitinivibrionales bacterium]
MAICTAPAARIVTAGLSTRLDVSPSCQSTEPALAHIYFYLSGACNLRCRHCWIDPRAETQPGMFVPWAEWQRVFVEAKELGLRAVKLTGGEPLLHPEALEIMRELKRMGLSITMETNGTLIDAEVARTIKETCSFVSVSVDGPTAESHEDLRGVKGAFDQTCRGMELLKHEGMRFQVITCLHRRSRPLLADMVTFAREAGAESVKINPITATARGERMREQGELLTVAEVLQTYRELEEWDGRQDGFRVLFDIPPAFKSIEKLRLGNRGTCGILGILGILHNGVASLCGIGETVDDLAFGNVLESGVADIWRAHETLCAVREHMPHRLGGLCERCMMRTHCLGKCIAHTYVDTGDLFSGYPFCQQAYEEGLFPASRLQSEVSTVAAGTRENRS